MSLFRRRRPLHARLADEGGLHLDEESAAGGSRPAPSAAAVPSGLGHVGAAGAGGGGFLLSPPDVLGNPSRFGEVAFHGVARPRRWDAVVSVEADLPGSQHEFVAVPDGTLVVGDDVPDDALVPLADAVEAAGASPPYRALALHQEQRVWAVGAIGIDVRELPGEEGDELERVQGDVVLRGRRVDGDLWEVDEHRL